jgi:aromatic ring-opening dioxygenase catalytic subunit (LigB family)
MSSRLPTFFLTHGGGPWPFMQGEFRAHFARLEAALQQIPSQLEAAPRAILVISGHWEERDFAVMSSPAPPMIYDFAGFPPETYRIRYSSPGAPALAQQIAGLIRDAGLDSHLDPARGYDHGVYSVLAVAWPEAGIPVLQVSLRADFDPAAHLALGRALAPLCSQGVLIIGSGSSYHNLRGFFEDGPHHPREESAAFDAWLRAAMAAPPAQRTQALLDWEQAAPHALLVQPTPDHFLPLHVAVGAAESAPATLIYHEDSFFRRLSVSSFRLG